MKVYRFAVHPAEEGYFFLQCINAPGLFTQARSLEECVLMARDVVKAMLEEDDVQIELTVAPDVEMAGDRQQPRNRLKHSKSRATRRRAVAA